MATVQVRYIVNDVDAAIAFYCQHLGFVDCLLGAKLQEQMAEFKNKTADILGAHAMAR